MTSFDEKILNAVCNIAGTTTTTTTTSNPFKGKWVSILGDSISTFVGYNPDGQNPYYPTSDVTDVKQTWWHILLTKLGAKLCVNESYGGRKVCGEAAADVVNAVSKLHRVKGQTYINLDGTTEIATEDIQPDIILILLGTNDFGASVTLGELNKSTAGTENMNVDFYNSYNSMLINIAGIDYINAQIYLLNGVYSNAYNFIGYNTNKNTQVDFIKAVEETARLFYIHCLHLANIGVNGGNVKSFMASDGLHPKANMMKMIANQCYNEMMADNCL